MKYRWILSDPSDEDTVQKLAQTINVSPTIARILVARGVRNFDQAKQFFRPSLTDLHDPFLMDTMDLAVERSIRAVESGEKVAIYGDYDVDGTNSAAMLYLYFKSLGADVEFYIPDRFTEGYGISTVGIDRLVQSGVRLIVTIDCGITAVDQVAYANSLGVDVIICDHHECGDTVPPAYAVLDPIKPGCSYPFKYLSGAGVGFKLMQGIAKVRNEPETCYPYLDFVAIAAAADIVPLVGENRSLVSHGLRRLNDAPRPGFRGLLECAGIRSTNLGTSQIVFGIAPRINAAGRLGDARRAVEMLIEEDEVRAFQRAQELESENRSRRAIDEETFAEAQAIADSMIGSGCRSLVIHNSKWHAGVIGIVASRLVERYYLPTVLLTTVDGVAKGSARSIAGFDIYTALKQCESHIEQFGGHRYAAGLSIREENIAALRGALDEYARREISDGMLTPELHIDAEVQLEELSPRFFTIIKQFAPFGPGNARPLFILRNAQLAGYPRIVGKDHLKFRVRNGSGWLEAIAFGMGSRMPELNTQSKFDLVFNIEENEYRGTITQQFRIHDFRIADVANGHATSSWLRREPIVDEPEPLPRTGTDGDLVL
ncbi:MAG TPA: single-stranded-DNA-specific exonuclease RecJ [Candidatus Kapabacteria bacterium]|nr:single-stranded-DNA-specific exonuclease RecJ [Candidatus Kapabacteria bacterium]